MEKLKDFRARLVNGGNNSSPSSVHLIQAGDSAHDVVRGGAVEATRGLVKEEELGPREDLNADADSPLLAAAEALRSPPADSSVEGVLQPHLSYRRVRSLLLLRRRHGVW